MSRSAPIDTPFLVLRKTAYSDTSLVIAGISPTAGQVHFLLRGAQRLGRKQFPVVDVFRLLQVQYRDTNAELHHITYADMTEDFGGVARSVDAYQAAGWLALFALGNVPAALEHPTFFETLCIGFRRLADAHRYSGDPEVLTDAVVVGVCLTYLEEGGWLAENAEEDPNAAHGHSLLAMASGHGRAPHLTADTWHRLRQWVMGLLRAADCHVPPLSSGDRG